MAAIRTLLSVSAASAALVSTLPAQVVSNVERDEMTGKTNAYATWASDTLEGHMGPFQAIIMFRCRNGKLDALLTSPGNPIGERQNKNGVQRAFAEQSRGEAQVKLKVDTTLRIEAFDVTVNDNAVIFRTGVWPGVIDLTKDLAKRILRAEDFILVRYTSIWDIELTPKFHLGPPEERMAAIQRVFDTCGKKFP